MPKFKHYPQLDTFRALSIILVICFHCNFLDDFAKDSFLSKIFGHLDIGVDCFFILSGFLITRILIMTKNKEGYYKKFFVRRLLRIVPLYYLLLATAFIIIPLFDLNYTQKWNETESLWYWLYLSNFAIAAKNQFNHGIVDLSWSLSIEEQFYIFWPLLVSYFNTKSLKKLCYFGIIISISSQTILTFLNFSAIQVHLYTFCRLTPLMFGALMAISSIDEKHQVRYLNYKTALISFILFLILNTQNFFISLYVFQVINYFLVALFFASLIQSEINREELRTIFTIKIINKVGLYSYGIYLIHNPVQKILYEVFFKKTLQLSSTTNLYLWQILHILITIIISTLLAALSYHLYESQFLKLKKRFSY